MANAQGTHPARQNIATNTPVVIEDRRSEFVQPVWETLYTRKSPKTGKSHRFYQMRLKGAFIRTSDLSIVEQTESEGLAGLVFMVTSFKQEETSRGIVNFVHLARANEASTPTLAVRFTDEAVQLADIEYQPA